MKQTLSLQELGDWFVRNPTLGEILDRSGESQRPPLLIFEHADHLYSVSRGYGVGVKPEDYLDAFAAYIERNRDMLPVLTIDPSAHHRAEA